MGLSIDIIRDKVELKGTAYVEIYPGRNKNQFWNEESIFFNEESFGFVEKTIANNFEGYDHYDMMEVPVESWKIILKDLEGLSQRISTATSAKDFRSDVYFFFKSTESEFSANFEQNKVRLVSLLNEFCTWVSLKLKETDVISVLGL